MTPCSPNAVAATPGTCEYERDLTLDLVQVTEAAALAAHAWVGRGDKNSGDQVLLLPCVTPSLRSPSKASSSSVTGITDGALLDGVGWKAKGGRPAAWHYAPITRPFAVSRACTRTDVIALLTEIQ